MAELLGIINFENDNVHIAGLEEFRTIPALSFLGRYRVIDFVLSNMVNSSVHNINILVKDKPRSLIEHVDKADQYNINVKHGSLRILYTDEAIVNRLYFTDLALLNQYKTSIEENSCDYVLLAPSNMICRINYHEVLKAHIASKKEVTCVYKKAAGEEFHGCQALDFEGGNISAFRAPKAEMDNISMDSYIMAKDVFLKIIEQGLKASPLYNFTDYLAASLKQFSVGGYEYQGYLRCINSFEKYYQANMELIKVENARELLDPQWPIYTQTNDSPPAFYTRSAQVKNSLIANGCVVHGTLDNCILGRGVIVEKGAVVKNSILLPNCTVGPDADIDYAVIDKHAKVLNIKNIHGNKDQIAYIKRRDLV